MMKKVNYKGQWIDVEFTAEEIADIKSATAADNKRIADEIYKVNRGLPDAVVAVLVQNATQHWAYRVDEAAYEYAKNMLKKDE